MKTFHNFNDAQDAADRYFKENFDMTASVHHDSLGDDTYEFHSADDPGMDDTFICKVILS